MNSRWICGYIFSYAKGKVKSCFMCKKYWQECDMIFFWFINYPVLIGKVEWWIIAPYHQDIHSSLRCGTLRKPFIKSNKTFKKSPPPPPRFVRILGESLVQQITSGLSNSEIERHQSTPFGKWGQYQHCHIDLLRNVFWGPLLNFYIVMG